ncbi:MAG: DUF4203 domain-containing protein [Candidatus Omnitrophica bacterium]|nr:DUF4203 domain-containing protein [Candidatus Omnitrophota bacterium]
MTEYPIAVLLAGVLLLVAGRKLFWLFVALSGFLVGIEYAPFIFDINSNAMLILISLGLGILGAVLAVFLQGAAILIFGFLVGGYTLSSFLIDYLGLIGPAGEPAIFLAGGIISAVFLALVFDWALIVLSSFLGALLLSELSWTWFPYPVILTFIFFSIGVITQAVLNRNEL